MLGYYRFDSEGPWHVSSVMPVRSYCGKTAISGIEYAERAGRKHVCPACLSAMQNAGKREAEKLVFSVLDEDPPPKLDWSKPSKAVVACDGLGHGCVLWTAGPHVDSMINEAGFTGLDDLGLDDAPEGISIWEGGIKSVHHNTPDANEHEWWLEGSFREPTDKEWESIRLNMCPWDNTEWLKKQDSST